MARRSVSQVLAEYSSSFSFASRLLPAQVRSDIHNLYAMVRIADEIVDGAAQQSGLTALEVEQCLDNYRQSVLEAPESHFHPDPVMHAYADTARRCGFQSHHIEAFFEYMRMDLHRVEHDATSFAQYVYANGKCALSISPKPPTTPGSALTKSAITPGLAPTDSSRRSTPPHTPSVRGWLSSSATPRSGPLCGQQRRGRGVADRRRTGGIWRSDR